MSDTTAAVAPFALPPLGDNPSTDRVGTNPGSFANKGRVGTAYAYSSPDMPGMPPVSDRTAWDFLPAGWSCVNGAAAGQADGHTSARQTVARERFTTRRRSRPSPNWSTPASATSPRRWRPSPPASRT